MELMYLVSLLLAVLATSEATQVACDSNAFCEVTLREGSQCVNGFCDNPFQYGCLRSRKVPGFENHLRICNSEDAEDAPARGLCRQPVGLEYPEVRIVAGNWDSPFLEAWVLEILLTELLDVPVTIEIGSTTKTSNFYDPKSQFNYAAKAYDWDALRTSSEIGGDCRNIQNENDDDSYVSCGHAILEMWYGFEQDVWEELDEAIKLALEPPSTIGVVGDEKWFIPRYTAERDSSLSSYLGLKGLENRRKLAETFLRPTTWADYCNEVSDDGCVSGVGAAQRAPESEEEGGKYFSDGLYTGHFRKTEDNDCDASPTTCTGHFVDYPCGWKRWFAQQSYHLDIGLKSNGNEPAGGYTYSQMIDIFYAANMTQSDVIGLWWRPENLYQQFLGTPFEFHEVNLPNPHSKCVENRISIKSFCGEVEEDKENPFGSPEGTCDFPPVALVKVASNGLRKLIDDPAIPEAMRSPALDVLNRFTIDTYQLEKIFAHWLSSSNVDKYGYNIRDAVCDWVVENVDDLARYIPHSFPRQLEEKKNTVGNTIALVLGAIATIATLACTVLTYVNRKKRVFMVAQLEFVLILLFGLLLVSLSAMTTALQPSNASCITTVWLVNIGYNFELIPLIVKIAAINKLMQAAKKMRRVKLSKNYLYKVVAVLTAIVVIFVIVWTVVDPPAKHGDYHLTDEATSDGITTVSVSYSCRSGSGVWSLVSIAFQALLLLCASFLAFMTRKMKNDVNETTTVAFLIYWNFLCVLLRIILVFLKDSIGPTVQNVSLSIILSIDTLASIVIYFVPKFLKEDKPNRNSNVSTYINQSKLNDESSKPMGSTTFFPAKNDTTVTYTSGRESVQSYHENENDVSNTQDATDRSEDYISKPFCNDKELCTVTETSERSAPDQTGEAKEESLSVVDEKELFESGDQETLPKFTMAGPTNSD